MECKWHYEDCVNTEQCTFCSTPGYYYKPAKQKQRTKGRAPKKSSRKGSAFEESNHKKNEELFISSNATPNSGAGSVKGDEQIRGLVTAMEELKQQSRTTARGKKTFSISKDWLEKLEQEAGAHEFWYLKFSYDQYGHDVYVVTSQEMVMSMIKTIAEDRKALKLAEAERDIDKKRMRYLETEIVRLKAEKDLLEAQLHKQQLESEENI